MKKLLQSLFILLLAASAASAQERTISGTVVSKGDNLPIPGVTVKVPNTKIGAVTNANGAYSINVPTTATTLSFQFLGFISQTLPIGATSTLNVALAADSKQLSEVVVTALGISKSARTLGYSQTTVKSADINASAPVSLFGGLQGKVAGVNISNTSGAPGGSTKVILRGYSSITGSNQPLYVVDGVPLDNSTTGSDNSYDFGNNANDIDPNNIESISLLNGSASTALYGSRGSNGVILITTKKGASGKLTVDLSTSTTITNVASVFKPQDKFGQGWDGSYIPSENGNWGPKYDGQLRSWGAVVDNSQLLKPFSFIKNNVRDALTTGIELNNNIALSGGNENSTAYFSYGNIYSDGYLPGDNDSYKRNNFNLKGSTKYGNFTADASLNYVGKTSKFIAQGQGDSGIGAAFYEEILQIPADIPIKDLRDYKNKFFNVDNYFTPYAENPYYPLSENGSDYKSDRAYGNVNLTYKATNWLSLQLQQGADVTNAKNKIWHNKNAPSPGSYNDGGNIEGQSRAADVGNVIDGTVKNFEYDTKLNALFNKELSSSFGLDGLIGANYNDRGSNALFTSIEDLAIPGFYQINNSANKPTSSNVDSHRRLFGAYATATLDYNKYVYLTLTGRNDWSSTLPQSNNSYFYPAASVAFLASQALNLTTTPISFLKLRASYGETGSDTGPYRVFNSAIRTSVPLGFGNITFPFFGVPGYSISNQLNSDNFKPERVKELEFGADIRFLKDRIAIDATYYNKESKDQIIPLPIDPSTGYSSYIVNSGSVRNKGVEIAATVKPIETSAINWNLTYTFTKENSKITALPLGLDKVIIVSAYDAQFIAQVGQPLGIIEAPTRSYSPSGQVIVDGNGYPVSSEKNVSFGSTVPDFIMGLNNQFRYKDFSLSFTLDWHKGGVFYSGTADLLNFVGADSKTTYNDRHPFIVPNSVQKLADGTFVENTTPITEANMDDFYYTTSNKADGYANRILDKSFLKLREATLSYSLPKFIAGKVGAQKASVSVFGRNLLTWLAKDNNTIDPEVSNYGNDLSSEFGEFRTAPPVRFFGASLKVSF